jgi:hypothetical protein
MRSRNYFRSAIPSSIGGERDAMSCTLWARGTGLPLTMATTLDHVLDHCGSTHMTGGAPYRHCRGCAVCLALRSSRSGEGEAWLVKPAFIALKKK